MVTWRLVMPENVDMSTDRKIAVVLYALEKHGPKALGITRTYAYLLGRWSENPATSWCNAP